MPFCTSKDCYRKGQDLPIEEFRGKGKTYKQCSECRSRQLAYKQHGKMGVSGKGFRITTTPVGTEPKFLHEGHKRMYEEWLREIVGQVKR